MTPEDQEKLREIVATEVRRIVRQEFAGFAVGCIRPIVELLVEIQKSQGLIADGQTLVERALAERFPDDDDWRRSL